MAEAVQIYDVVFGSNTAGDVNDWAKIRHLVCSVKLLRRQKSASVEISIGRHRPVIGRNTTRIDALRPQKDEDNVNTRDFWKGLLNR